MDDAKVITLERRGTTLVTTTPMVKVIDITALQELLEKQIDARDKWVAKIAATQAEIDRYNGLAEGETRVERIEPEPDAEPDAARIGAAPAPIEPDLEGEH